MRLSDEKTIQIIAALDAAEKALLALDTEANCIVAGQCAVAKVYLETAQRDQTVHYIHSTGVH
jgi:hypothetical protein